MRWDGLFGDLDAQWHAASQEQLERAINEQARVEAALVGWVDAFRGAVGQDLALLLRHGVLHHGQLVRAEEQWVLLRQGSRSLIVPLSKVIRVQGLGVGRVPPVARLRYTLAAALRVLARNRAVVSIELDTTLGTTVVGVLDQVGADFVTVTQLADGVTRHRANQQGSVVVPLAAMATVSSSADNTF